jgi:hypothetical protein
VERTVTLRDEIAAGVVAGLVGGVLTDLFLLVALVSNGTPLPAAAVALYGLFASVAMGPAAAANPGTAIPVGIAVHFCVAIGWALGYVYLARTQPHVLRRPIVSGLGFGVVVFVFMDVALVMSGVTQRPTPGGVALTLASYLVFYGIPVALVVSRMLARPSTRSGRAA